MIDEFISLMCDTFPSIQPYTKDRVRESFAQFYSEGKHMQCFLSQPLKPLCQGDIISSLPFIRYDAAGQQREFRAPGIMLSHSCTAANDDEILFAPLLPVNSLRLDQNLLLKNLYYPYLYFPDSEFKEFLINLSILSTFDKNFIGGLLDSGGLNKLASLNSVGYYFFICKLTVHFLRPDAPEALANRESA